MGRHPRNSFGLVFGVICAYVILKVFMASPGWDSLPVRPWVVGLFLLMAVMWGSEIFRKMFDRTWPDEEKRDRDVHV
jgi:hypothetical protein